MSMPVAQRERIANLLSHGVSQAVIAAAVGLSPGRLTQLLEEDSELHAMLAKEAAKTIDQTIAKEGELDTLERQIMGVLPGLVNECTSLGEGMRALQVLSDIKAKAKGYAPAGSSSGIGVGVQVSLGSIAQMKISVVVDGKKSILELGGQQMTAMPREAVTDFLEGVYDEHAADDEADDRGSLCAG